MRISDWSSDVCSSDLYGDDGFKPRFAKAVDHLNGIGMDAAGERAASGVCQWLLTSRLQLFDDRKRFPIGDEVIERPMFATGEPRSGTTLMHALMSVDPEDRKSTRLNSSH